MTAFLPACGRRLWVDSCLFYGVTIVEAPKCHKTIYWNINDSVTSGWSKPPTQQTKQEMLLEERFSDFVQHFNEFWGSCGHTAPRETGLGSIRWDTIEHKCSTSYNNWWSCPASLLKEGECGNPPVGRWRPDKILQASDLRVAPLATNLVAVNRRRADVGDN